MRTREIVRWLAEPRLAWLTAIVVAASVYFATRAGATEFHVRVISAALQLLGVGNVAWGIRETRQLFNRPGIVDWTQGWFKRFPFFRRQIITPMAGSASLEFNAAGQLHGWVTARTGANASQRLQAVEQNVRLLQARCQSLEANVEKRFGEHVAKLKSESATRTQEAKEIRQLLVATETGGLALSTAGAVWLVLGIVLGTFPEEIAGWAGW